MRLALAVFVIVGSFASPGSAAPPDDVRLGVGVGGAWLPIDGGSAAGALQLHLESSTGPTSLRLTPTLFTAASPSWRSVGAMVVAEYRATFGRVLSFGLGPLIGYGVIDSLESRGTDYGTLMLGVSLTPIALRLDPIELGLSTFAYYEAASGFVSGGGFVSLALFLL